MIYSVLRIDEDLDFGCEEREEGAPVMAVVTILDEDGIQQVMRMEDDLLYEREINEGDKVTLDEKKKLVRICLWKESGIR